MEALFGRTVFWGCNPSRHPALALSSQLPDVGRAPPNLLLVLPPPPAKRALAWSWRQRALHCVALADGIKLHRRFCVAINNDMVYWAVS